MEATSSNSRLSPSVYIGGDGDGYVVVIAWSSLDIWIPFPITDSLHFETRTGQATIILVFDLSSNQNGLIDQLFVIPMTQHKVSSTQDTIHP